MTATNEELVSLLRGGTPEDKAKILYSVDVRVGLDPDIISAIEGLLDDRTIVRMFVPFRYGELRYYAADAPARIRARRGERHAILLSEVPRPMGVDRMAETRFAAGLGRLRGSPEAKMR
jgi:hypothetical protein